MRIELISVQNSINRNNRMKCASAQVECLDNAYSPVRLPGSEVPFGAIHGIKPPKIDILTEKLKLEQSVNDLLEQVTKYSPEAMMKKAIAEYKAFFISSVKHKLKGFKSKDVQGKLDYLDGVLPKTQEGWTLIYNKILDNANKMYAMHAAGDKTDYELVNKLHIAILDDNLNLDKIYKEHYSQLNTVTKASEVNKYFPKLSIPPNPKRIIGEKIANIMDRNFYIEFGQLREEVSRVSALEYFSNTFDEIINKLAAGTKIDAKILGKKLKGSTYGAVIRKYNAAKTTHGFSSYPDGIRVPKNLLSKDEIKLLFVDYDKFVLSVLRQQYIEGKKLSEIVYKEGNISISPKALGNTSYKFEKPDEKIKTIIKNAKKIQQHERDYEKFDKTQLQNRLKYYGNSPIADNETILTHLIEFDSSQFTEGDREPLIKFLRVLDDINDEKITIEDGKQIILSENLRPHGTIGLNKVKMDEIAQKLRIEQKYNAQFRAYCQKFNAAIAELYKSKMEEAAVLCSVYRPKNAKDTRNIANKILEIIAKCSRDGEFINPKKLDAELKYLNKYYHYKTYERENPIFMQAAEFGMKPNGRVDEIRAGQYLLYSEILEQYPASMAMFSEHEAQIISVICEKFKGTPAISKLVQFDNYRLLPEEEQLKITNLLKTFDICSSPENKPIVESFIDNIYLKRPTVIQTTLKKEHSQTIDSEILPEAKEMIIKDKKFPLCLEYFEAFERAMTHLGQFKEDNGIQVIGSNNKMLKKLYKQEVKITKDERLYSTTGDYKFDVYKPGLHKNKSTKS